MVLLVVCSVADVVFFIVCDVGVRCLVFVSRCRVCFPVLLEHETARVGVDMIMW